MVDRVRAHALRRLGQLLIDGAIVAVALDAAYMIRFDGPPPAPYNQQLLLVLPVVVLVYLAANVLSGSYRRIWRFFGLNDALVVAGGVAGGFLFCLVWRILDPGLFADTPVPYGVVAIHPFFTYVGLVEARIARRMLHERTAGAARNTPSKSRTRVLLVGAGEAGLNLLRELKDRFEVVGFLDDDHEIQGRMIGGWQVLGTTADLELVVLENKVDEVVLCIPSAPKPVLQKLAARCAELPVKSSSVPTLAELMAGKRSLTQLTSTTEVKMEDLLGRDSIKHLHDVEELTAAYAGRRILVTGAGGSIGSELVRQLKALKPSRLILLDKDENNLYEIACEIKEDFAEVTEVVADVRDLDVVERTFALHRPEVVFHAAAYKHVPLMEHNAGQAILNNVMGTRNLVEVSDRFGVKNFVFISTDKAVNPTSTMGASKRVAELIVQKHGGETTNTRFCCVRFGNVLGSRASVVPLFQRQIMKGRNITVTHPDVRRYFMTIPEAVQLVIKAGSLGKRGEIFLLDMGDPVKIVDLARNLIELSGLVPDRDVKIEFTGLRPGEKLNEELLIAGELGARSTKYSKIFVVEALDQDRSLLELAVNSLEDAARFGDTQAIRRLLRELKIGYQERPLPKELVPVQASGEQIVVRRKERSASLLPARQS